MGEQLAMQGGAPVRTLPFGPSHYFGEEDIEALSEVINSGALGKGPKVAQFEREFAARHGVAHVVTVTSGTAAMHTCIGAINPDPGDEIIVTPWTSGGSIIGTLLHNCVPIFADVDDTYTLNPADVEAKITPRTRAIIAVHLFGNPCDMAALREDMSALRGELRAESAALRGELREESAALRGELREGLQALRTEIYALHLRLAGFVVAVAVAVATIAVAVAKLT